jgi:hypothetical protein
VRTVVAALVPTLFWAGSLLRIPAARRSAPQRTLSLSLAAFAAALTLNVPAVYVAFDRAVGVPNLADLGEHLCGVWGVAGILRLARQVTATATATAPAGRAWHELAVPGLATVALTVLFVLAPTPAEAPSFTVAYGDLPEITAYWMVTIAYFGITLAALARLSLHYAGRAGRLSLRIGLEVLGAGVALGVAYSLSKLAELVAAQLPHADAAQHVAATTGHILLGVGALTMSVGLLIPALGPRLRAVERAARTYVALHRLRPLWETLWRANPDILLDPPPARWRDLLAFRQLESRLYRRVIEIEDGLLALRPYVTDDIAHEALAAATGAGLVGRDRDATVDACCLAVAVAAKRSGRASAATAASHIRGTRGAADLAGEVRLLCQLARVLRRSPVVRTFAARTRQPSTVMDKGAYQ